MSENIVGIKQARSSRLVYYFADIRERAERAEESFYHPDGELGGLPQQTFTDLDIILANIQAIRLHLASAEAAIAAHLSARDMEILPCKEEGPLPRVDPY